MFAVDQIHACSGLTEFPDVIPLTKLILWAQEQIKCEQSKMHCSKYSWKKNNNVFIKKDGLMCVMELGWQSKLSCFFKRSKKYHRYSIIFCETKQILHDIVIKGNFESCLQNTLIYWRLMNYCCENSPYSLVIL